jgi:hypothetical protein
LVFMVLIAACSGARDKPPPAADDGGTDTKVIAGR